MIDLARFGRIMLRISPFVTILVLTSVALGTRSLADEAAVAKGSLSYNEDIRPILADKCFACHGADSATREGGLRLDLRDDAVTAGAIEPGVSDNSEMIARILLPDDDDGLMPPNKSHKALSEAEKQTLIRWVNEGAEYQPHWSFIPPTRVELPTVSNPAWVTNPIDAFVLARLDAEGLAPAAEADRRTLARRAALDVIGLPPDPQWVEEFVADTAPDAYEKYLDRLFSQPAWGEHRGRYWLDYARYADTHGIHFDNYREVWAYRDWVIQAFNLNMPYDQFTIEQLAGDLLENPTLDQKIATGFNRCNITTNEGGIIDEEYAVLYARDRTETTSAVWMGLTTGCAVCHDHKFDPVTMKDFYSLAAFFNNTTQNVRDGNIPNTPPVIVVPPVDDRGRWDELVTLVPETESRLNQLFNDARGKVASLGVTAARVAKTLPKPESLVFHAPLGEGVGDTTNMLVDGLLVPVTSTGKVNWADGQTQSKSLVTDQSLNLSIADVGDFDLRDPFTAAAWVYPDRDRITGAAVARMNENEGYSGWDIWINEGRLATHMIHKWPDHAIKIISKDTLPVKQWSHVAIVNDGLGTIEGIRLFVNGVEQKNRDVTNNTVGELSIRTNAPLTIGRRFPNAVAEGLRINDIRLYAAALNASELGDVHGGTAAMFAASLPAQSLPAPQADLLTRWWLSRDSQEYRETQQSLDQLRRERDAIQSRSTLAHIMNEKPEPAVAYILNRGEYDQRQDQVTADTPASLPPLGDLPRNRLGLAKWLVSNEHPLTARVTVNRFWQEVFGTGLVRTSADFGITGELPSHPELLDYLAVDFRETGWDVRRLFRMMLTSNTYRQSAVVSEKSLTTDPENRLLARGPRYRMDAEMVRDMSLWASGLLSPKIGGASVRPYQPPGVWEAVAMPGSNTRDYREDSGDALFRRSMYTFWKRSAPPASMEIFGAPSREVCTIRRERTNTPLQALVMLNDPQFVEASRKLAASALAVEARDDTARLQWIAGRLLSRALDPTELEIVTGSLAQLREFYRGHEAEAAALLGVGTVPVADTAETTELAAWTLLSSELMNLDETLCK